MTISQQDYLLICAAEEAGEVATEAIELEDIVNGGSKVVNLVLLTAELNDLLACLELLVEFKVIASNIYSQNQVTTLSNTPALSLALSCLSVQKVISKMLRFGIDNMPASKKLTGAAYLHVKIDEFLSIMQYNEIEYNLQGLFSRGAILAKKIKVMKHLALAIEKGIVSDPITIEGET